MAIALRQDAVDRSTLPIDPAGPDASESIVAMAHLDGRLMSKVACVTLERPYLDDPAQTVVLTWGYGDAIPLKSGGDFIVPDTSLLPDQDRAFAQARWEAGKPIHYHLRFTEGPLGRCDCGGDPETTVGPVCYMPVPVAKAYFGDWDVVAYGLRQRPGMVLDEIYTMTYHRDRVAEQMWGGYGWDFPAGSPGVRANELRRFDLPKIPHVTVQRVDSMNRLMPNTKVRPWDIFKWESLLHKGERAYHGGTAPRTDPSLITVSEAQFEAMIEKAVNAKLAHMAVSKRSSSA